MFVPKIPFKSMNERKVFFVKTVSCAFVALAFLFGALHSYIKVQNKIALWSSTDATIVGFSIKDYGDGFYFHPQLAFRTNDGQTVKTESTLGRSSNSFVEGETMRILYCPDKPTEILENTFMDLYMPSLAWIAFAAVPAFFAFSTFRKYRKQ